MERDLQGKRRAPSMRDGAARGGRAASVETIGLIADTHGLVRPQALDALAGVDLIIHAGDIGKPEVLTALERIAPVAAVKGNVDRGDWAAMLPGDRSVRAGLHRFYVLHNLAELGFDPAARHYRAVISGHSHKPGMSERDGVLYINPGSAGPRRFKLPVAVARIAIREAAVRALIVELTV